MAIDLRKFRKPLATFIEKSLNTFSKKNPKIPICTVGLCGDGFHGTVSLSVDTPENSAAYVKKWLKDRIYGEDDEGRYCQNTSDMAHSIADFSFPGYPDLYKTDPPIDFIALDGSKQRAKEDEGDLGLHRIVFPLLTTVISEFEPFDQLNRVALFRVGAQMMDNEPSEFWIVKTAKK